MEDVKKVFVIEVREENGTGYKCRTRQGPDYAHVELRFYFKCNEKNILCWKKFLSWKKYDSTVFWFLFLN